VVEIDVVEEVRKAIGDARRKGITVLRGTPMTQDELATIERELTIPLPGDHRKLALVFGSLLFHKAGAHYGFFGKPSAETASSGLELDIRVQTSRFRENEILFDDDAKPSPLVALGARIDEDEGHFELVLGDATGGYRQVFDGGTVSAPRALVSTWGMFPFFAQMFDDAGRRLSAAELLALLSRS
jgi:hypothetical protein